MAISSEPTESRSSAISKSPSSTRLSITFNGLCSSIIRPPPSPSVFCNSFWCTGILKSETNLIFGLGIDWVKLAHSIGVITSLNFSRKRMFRSKQDRTLSIAETLTKWEECNVQLDSCKNEIKSVRKAPSIRLKKGMKGKGGPENSSCNYRGVIAEIREPKEKRSWLGTFENADDVAFSYDKAAKSGSCACLNFSDYCSAATPPNICLTATPTSSNCTTLQI
ncbi:hypothetical protein FH972_006348 [Carpinus fangiana]|uniref:AP2/ERF domain-containing protein n=1 Tax=Carpinus fangiana TaxID=176857 RepID=A0A5N6QUY7_9ROSI|nr:hypothetical protein FH972_006348 [Carpinus fangiana]